jgi:hypothetical protein
VISRALARRLNKLEERFGPAVEPMKIQVVFVEPNGTPNGGFEVVVGGPRAHPVEVAPSAR